MIDFYHRVIQQDLQRIVKGNIDINQFKNKTVLITGINGMIATYLAYTFIYMNQNYDLNIKIIGMGRNIDEFNRRFSLAQSTDIEFIFQDVTSKLIVPNKIDYIFHAATNASPEAMIYEPVEIALTNSIGTKNIADLAIKKNAHLHFFSTREVYGASVNNSLNETDTSSLSPLNIRDVYPISKVFSESLLNAYKSEHGLNFSVSRIAHAFGPTMRTEGDGRVMADFLGKVLNNKDIVLNSDGSSERAFIYISDVISAILHIVLNSDNKSYTYNVSNESEPITVLQLAKLISNMGTEFQKKTQVLMNFQKNVLKSGYSTVKRVPLNTTKLETLGWKPEVKLESGILNTLIVLNNENKL